MDFKDESGSRVLNFRLVESKTDPTGKIRCRVYEICEHDEESRRVKKWILKIKVMLQRKHVFEPRSRRIMS